MKTFQIWTEGYRATCEHGTARYVGAAEGETFAEAVQSWYALHGTAEDKTYFDPERLTYWGCRFFDNEIDAQRSFG